MCSRLGTSITVTVVGAVVTIVAAVLAFYGFDEIINNLLENELRLDKKGEAYNNFMEAPIDIYMKFYMFNITNFDQHAVNGSNWKPILQEVGPYVYVEKRSKENVTFFDNYEQVEFMQLKSFYFSPEHTAPGLSESDTIVMINAPILGMLALASEVLPSFIIPTLGQFMFDETINAAFLKATVNEILFSGAESNFLAKLMGLVNSPLGDNFPPLPPNIVEWQDEDGNTVTGFAYYPKNNTAEGPYTIRTGKGDLTKYQDITSFQGMTQVDYWVDKNNTDPMDSCNRIHGTDGTAFKPFVKKSDKLNIFNTDVCRVLYLEYVKETKVMGIDSYRFAVPAFELADHVENPDNLCYCIPDESGCLGDGIINLQTCLDIPVYMSLPHFYMGEPSYLEAVDGLSPDAELHSTFIDIEPLTGFPLKAAKRIQMNMRIDSYDVSSFPDEIKNLPNNLILPVIWADEYAEVTKELADDFKSRIATPLKIMDIGQWILLAIGIIVTIVGAALSINFHKRKHLTKK